MVQIPKPRKADRVGVRRRKYIKKRDKTFQIEGEAHFCAVGHYSEQTTSHHHIGRRAMQLRWERDNTARLCYQHHTELHSIGEKAFSEKYPEWKEKLQQFS